MRPALARALMHLRHPQTAVQAGREFRIGAGVEPQPPTDRQRRV